ncbi:uncharacterized protein LOC111329735 [Stylophora pistillata]|uniref:uncharacterized protein LOC111329735 n=1 Tax=Stylophora pistillata TaxID=50429 RepID=UPI000C04DA79|nr:uncharacterized protein LOC111329735 [Stylophora pistillata]
MEAFPLEDRGKDIRDLDLRQDCLPTQRSLGVYWDLTKDAFTFKVCLPRKPFTRRGVLSVVKAVYDPLGLAVPVLLEERVTVPRCYHPADFGRVAQAELHAFSDASKDAPGACVYLRLVNDSGEVATSLVFGQSKVAPLQTTSIPRLELCGAMLATQAVARILKEIDIQLDDIKFYTDSKAALGYIQNESRRFYVYVANRVEIIRRVSSPDQWSYIETSDNPADLATRCLNASSLANSAWLKGQRFLRNPDTVQPQREDIQLAEDDPEVQREVVAHASCIYKCRGLGAERFSRFSNLHSLKRAIARLIVKVKEFRRQKNEQRQPKARQTFRSPTANQLNQAMDAIMGAAQKEAFGAELTNKDLTEQKEGERYQNTVRKRALKGSQFYALDPFIDANGIVRVGGRLRRAEMEYGEKHPAILPKDHHVSVLVIRHYHKEVHHQGRQITSGKIRQAGYWLIGGHRMVAKELASCVPCKKLRGPHVIQKMADLPQDRTEVGPPFTNVGFDVFGPWTISTRKTRGGAAHSKRWGLVFTCLNSRAIHIEVLESMDASSFICALRRFFAIRGPTAVLRCDRGTNFVGGHTELAEALKEMDETKIERFVTQHGCEWKFNPPHASHFGGVWERQIGTIRRVLDAMLADLGPRQLTHEILSTFMAEVTAIVNARPIAALPSDINDPQPLSPAMLLTMKTRPPGPPPGNFLPPDLYANRRWRRVQYLADQFWLRWRREYLQNLQPRRKWYDARRDLAPGDVVLMKEDSQNRSDWPMGRVTEAIRSADGKVRKVSLRIVREGRGKVFLRPIKELILLVPVEAQ